MTSTGSALAARLQEFETPPADIDRRLAIAADIAAGEPVLSALVVGSTALRRCSARADLDVVLITAGGERFSSHAIDGVKVEIERLDLPAAYALTAGQGWVWELRDAARLGCGIPVLDPDGIAGELSRRAAAMAPWPDKVAAILRDVYLRLLDLSRGGGPPAPRMDALRGCLDNLVLLALLAHPRRYQKAKWALADLVHAGELALADAVLAAYGIVADDDGVAASAAVAGAREVIRRTFAGAGLPPHEQILALGHTVEFAEASYVSRCLDDAEDLAASGRHVEAQYVALFSARLAAGLLGDRGSVLDTFGDDLGPHYLALFPVEQDPDDGLLAAVLTAADDRRAA